MGDNNEENGLNHQVREMNHLSEPPIAATLVDSNLSDEVRTSTPIVFRETPLHRACMENKLEKARELIENGAEVHAKDRFGNTAFHRTFDWFLDCRVDPADGNAQLEIAKLLYQNGADVNVMNNDGMTPLHLACSDFEDDSLEAVTFLTQKGADIHAKNKDGKTPLHIACEYGHLNKVQFLLSRGANANAETTHGTTPLLVACEHDEPDVVWLLVRHYQEVVLEPLK